MAKLRLVVDVAREIWGDGWPAANRSKRDQAIFA